MWTRRASAAAKRGSGDGAEFSVALDGDVDFAIEHLLEEPEFFAAGEDSAGLAGILAQLADDSNPAAAAGDEKARGREGAAVQTIGGAEKGENHAEVVGVVAAAKGGVFADAGNAAAVAQREESEGSPLALFQGQGIGLADEPCAFGGMAFDADGSADVVNDRGHPQQAHISASEIVKTLRGLNEGRSDTGDAPFVTNVAQVLGNPIPENREPGYRSAIHADSTHWTSAYSIYSSAKC